MEFPFDLSPVLGDRVCVVDQHLRPAGRRGPTHRYRGLGLRPARGMLGNTGGRGACWETGGFPPPRPPPPIAWAMVVNGGGGGGSIVAPGHAGKQGVP